MIKIKKLKIILLLSTFYFLLSFSIANGAILYLEPSIGEYHLDEVFVAEIKLDSQGEYINTIEAELNFSSDILEVQDLSDGNSILSLWIKKLEIVNNKISFIGGIPGGYQGQDGLIGKIIFKVQSANRNFAQVLFEKSSKVLLNDGKGTEVKLVTRGTIFNILPEALEKPENQWQKNLAEDKISPQPFKIEVSQSPLIFDGKYFITFSTPDKQTGIDHYEIKEGKGNWETAVSPYVLENQNLMGSIWVKAVDKAENYWIESIKFYQKSSWIFYGILGLLALVLIFVILKIVKAKIKQLPK